MNTKPSEKKPHQNLERRRIIIYNYGTTYLYEIMEDYHFAETDEEKAEIFQDFCSSIWNCPNRRRVYTKSVKFKVNRKHLDSKLGQIFDTWSDIEYKGLKSLTRDTDYASFIRQKVNNLYTWHFDKEVILQAEYLNLLKTPKKLYFSWLAGEELAADEVTLAIDDAIAEALTVREQLQKEKMKLTWAEYKKVMEGFFYRIFQSCKLINEYESTSAISNHLDCITEDNFYIRYFCRSLDGLMKNYQKEYYQVKRGSKIYYFRCHECHSLFERSKNNQKYCTGCALLHRQQYKAEKEKARRTKKNLCVDILK